MTDLTPTQATLLAAAARRPDGAVLPLPAELRLPGRALTVTLESLARRGLIRQRAKAGPRLTAAGRAAIGAAAPVPKAPAVAATPVGPAPTSKRDRLIALLRRPEGATLAEAAEALAWQKHSVRGAIAGTLKRALGLPVAVTLEAPRGRVYRLAPDASRTTLDKTVRHG